MIRKLHGRASELEQRTVLAYVRPTCASFSGTLVASAIAEEIWRSVRENLGVSHPVGLPRAFLLAVSDYLAAVAPPHSERERRLTQMSAPAG